MDAKETAEKILGNRVTASPSIYRPTAIASFAKLPKPQITMAESIVDRVHRELQERHQRGQAEGESDAPVVAWGQISLQDFDKWLEEQKRQLLHWDYEPLTDDTGRVIVHDLSPLHSKLILALLQEIKTAASPVTDPLSLSLVGQVNRTLQLGSRRYKLNGSLVPTTAPNDFTLVLELAYSESSSHLRDKLHRYMEHPQTQVVMGIKFPYLHESVHQHVILVQRDVSNQIVEECVDFGPDVQIPENPLCFPLWKLYHGGQLPPDFVGQQDRPIVIDLAWLMKFVEEHR